MLRSSFAQIKRIAILPILLRVLTICKCETSNRSDRLFYPLILYSITRLCKLPNRLDGLFYPLIFDSLLKCCASYQISQTNSSILWHLTACLLCKTPNRSNDTRWLFCYAIYQIDQMTLDNSFAIQNTK